MDEHNASSPGMPRIENLAIFCRVGPVGVTAPRCTTRCGRTAPSATKCLRRFIGRPAIPASQPPNEAAIFQPPVVQRWGKVHRWSDSTQIRRRSRGSGHLLDLGQNRALRLAWPHWPVSCGGALASWHSDRSGRPGCGCSLSLLGARLEYAASYGLRREDLLPKCILPLTAQGCTITFRD
jgi:hypothetical protein